MPKTELFGHIRAIDLDKFSMHLKCPEYEDRIEVLFPKRCTAYFSDRINSPVKVHGEWIEGGAFNAIRWV